MSYQIRNTRKEDVDTLMEIYSEARNFMAANGNPTQWGNGHPKRSLIEEDVEKGWGYAVTEGDEIKGTFALILGEDPTYRVIEGGSWLNEECYGTIHRIASRTSAHGVFQAAVEFAAKKVENIRVDTHRDNKPMQHLLEKYGFTYCGIIYVADGTPRVAYQKKVR